MAQVRISGSGPAEAGARKLHPSARRTLRAAVVIAVLCVSAVQGAIPTAAAQGIATAAIRGSVQSTTGGDLDGARVRVLNTATGVTTETRVRRGRFLIQGMEVGGPYVVEVLHVGFSPQRTEPMFLTLGEPAE